MLGVCCLILLGQAHSTVFAESTRAPQVKILPRSSDTSFQAFELRFNQYTVLGKKGRTLVSTLNGVGSHRAELSAGADAIRTWWPKIAHVTSDTRCQGRYVCTSWIVHEWGPGCCRGARADGLCGPDPS